ncbi:MAG TPA: bifunctional pyr operon transcriptional regulator/uracil phosphoribosyltransferase PyrR, partial [Petrotogaceae bacterium]|nr:bifunctional pyr operon transcriptional regulator/uracil phosphoribosyltransferase PyrR [Petrotogaceae bacterium]
MILKNKVMDSKDIQRTLMRLTHELLERNRGVENTVLLGIKKGGKEICDRIWNNIYKIENIYLEKGYIDVSPYRDDEKKNQEDTSEINFALTDKTVVLIDDVLFTGRTVRAAMEAIVNLGRPKNIQLMVLIDRGHREFPIKADYV